MRSHGSSRIIGARRLFDRGRTLPSHTPITHRPTPSTQPHHAHKLSFLDTFTQITLSGDNAIQRDIHAFGDKKQTKQQHIVRIGSHNENGINTRKNSDKSRRLFNYITNTNFDIWLSQEVGINWKYTSAHNSWYERLKSSGNREFKHSLAYNTFDETEDSRQYGGTAITVNDTLSYKIIENGKDKLGRWTWMKLQGKNTRIVTIISAYRPVTSREPGSVFNQHLRRFQQTNLRDTTGSIANPRSRFWSDLSATITTFHDAGEKIIIGIDCNEDVRNFTVKIFFLNLV
jgi:hypothetical protein